MISVTTEAARLRDSNFNTDTKCQAFSLSAHLGHTYVPVSSMSCPLVT